MTTGLFPTGQYPSNFVFSMALSSPAAIGTYTSDPVYFQYPVIIKTMVVAPELGSYSDQAWVMLNPPDVSLYSEICSAVAPVEGKSLDVSFYVAAGQSVYLKVYTCTNNVRSLNVAFYCLTLSGEKSGVPESYGHQAFPSGAFSDGFV